MAIIIYGNDRDMKDPVVKELFECFLCGKPLEDSDLNCGGFVYWQGDQALIAFHQPCAELFSIQLSGDARSLVERTELKIKLRPAKMVNQKGAWYNVNERGKYGA